MKNVPGTVYLIHFDEPYRHAKHYLGWAKDLQARLDHHANGSGANLMRVIKEAGISWSLARTWEGSKYRGRQLKKQGGRSRMCPVCKSEKANSKQEEDMPGKAAREMAAAQGREGKDAHSALADAQEINHPVDRAAAVAAARERIATVDREAGA